MWPASANIFAIKDDDGLILIEVGCGLRKFARQLFKRLESLNLNLDDVHTIVISHAHPDHMGAMHDIYKKVKPSDVKIVINEIEKESALNIDLLNESFDIDLIKQQNFEAGVKEFFGDTFDINQSLGMFCAMSQLPKNAYIQTVKDNDMLRLGNYQFKILTTPGHAPGHTSFYEVNHRFLLSGDLIGEIGVAWYSPSSGGAIGYLSSLEKVENLPIDYIYPSHGHKFNNVKERINQIREKILSKDEIILESLKEKPRTILELAQLFYKTTRSQVFPGVAIAESHLIKLEKERKIERENDMAFIV
ncbi:MAG: MBL fold metallo-hydrolase [Promethearchaeota archaeon]